MSYGNRSSIAGQQVESGLPSAEPVLGHSAGADATGYPDEAHEGLDLPSYLVRHYWWAYVWPPAVWFFDHQPIINSIVFGQYRKLVAGTLAACTPEGDGDNLLIASAYGNVVPTLTRRLGGQPLTVIDVAPIQLKRASAKLERAGLGSHVRLERMNAERLAYEDGSYDRALMFLLLHELPDDARRRTVAEALRVLKPGGELVMAEYGELTARHPFHRIGLLRWIFGVAEPFLPSLWSQSLDDLVAECARSVGKEAVCESRQLIFGGFYRAVRYRIGG